MGEKSVSSHSDLYVTPGVGTLPTNTVYISASGGRRHAATDTIKCLLAVGTGEATVTASALAEHKLPS